MKRSSLFLTLSFISALLIAAPVAAKSNVALVVKVKGKSYVLNGKKRRLYPNDLVREGEKIRSEKGAYAHIQFSGGIICMVGATDSVTEVSIDELKRTADSIKLELKLEKGSIATSADKLSRNDRLRVAGPTAIAGVRGTEFIVDVTDESNDSSTSVLVNDGSIEVVNPSGTKRVTVEAGSKIVADMKEFHKSIVDQFEKQRFEIFKAFEESKQKNFDMLIEQKEKDRKLLEEQKKSFFDF